MDENGLNWEIWAIVFGALVFIILIAALCSCYQRRRKRHHRQRLEAMMINYRESEETSNTRLSVYSRSKSSPKTPKRNNVRTASKNKRSSSVRIPPLSALPEHDVLDIEAARHAEETNKRLSLAPGLGIAGGVEDFRKKERRSQSTHSFTLEMIQEYDDRLSTYGKDVEDSIEM